MGKESVVRILSTIFIATFIVEIGIMFLLYGVDIKEVWNAFVDASLLVIILSPFLYFLVFKPMFHQTESELSRTKSHLEEVQRVAHLGHWELDFIKNDFSWSDETYCIFEMKPSTKVTYETFLEIVHPDDHELLDKAHAESVKNRTSCNIEYRLLMQDGSIKWVSQRCKTYYDDDGTPLRSLGTTLDITKRRQLENELMEHRDHLQVLVEKRTRELGTAKDKAETANKAKSAFLAAVSHELKTPLNSIIGFSDVLADGSAGPVTEEQKSYLGILHESGHSLLSLVNNILDLSSMQAGEVELELNEFDLDLSMTSWVQGMEQEFVNKNISFCMDVESGIGTVTADEKKLKQAIYHLLSNALKFTGSGGSTQIAARSVKGDAGKGHGEDWIEISVKDTGIGISQEDQKKLFQPFVQLDDSLSRQHEGTGLGLMICKHIVELHDGHIWVESETGKGSTFSFKIPRC
jgi:signal transduction histidine kinase